MEFKLDRRAFAYYNVQIGDWHVESGKYEIQIGASSRDIRARREVEVQSKNPTAPVPDYRALAPHYYNLNAETKIFEKKQFEAVYGRQIHEEKPPKKGEFTLNTTVEEARSGGIVGKIIYKTTMFGISRANKNEKQEDHKKMREVMAKEMPLRTLAGFSLGRISIEEMESYILMMNGHFFKGLWARKKAGKRKKELDKLD